MNIMLFTCLISFITSGAAIYNVTSTSDSTCTLGTATGCETNVAEGLTYQIVDEINAMVSFNYISYILQLN